MKKRSASLLFLSVILLAILFTPTAGCAELIYSTFGPGHSYNETSGFPIGTLPGLFDDTQRMEAAVSFTPVQNYTFNSIDVAALLDWFSVSPQFTVSLARDTGSNSPGAELEKFSFTGVAGSPMVYSASSVLQPQLTANEKYWVVMSSDDLFNIYLMWLDADSTIDGELAYKNGLYTDWVSVYAGSGQVPAFEVRGTVAAVPAPATIILLGTGLLALAGVKKRFKNEDRS